MDIGIATGTRVFDGDGGSPRVMGNDRRWVTFYRKGVMNARKSEESGAPVFDAVDFIKIQHPGEMDTTERPVREDEKITFKAQWDAYMAGREQIPDGIPIATLFPAQEEVVALLRHCRVHTVEQLAALTDTGLQSIGTGARTLQGKARDFLAMANKMAGPNRLQQQIDDLTARNEVLTQQVNQLLAARAPQGDNAADEGQEAAPRRGPGRPPKQAA